MIRKLILFTLFACLSSSPCVSYAQSQKKNSSKGKDSSKTGDFQQEILDELRYQEGNERENDVKALKAELLVSASEARAIQQLNHLIRKYQGTPVEPGLWFRLAELHMRRAKSSRFFEMIRKGEMPMSSIPPVVKDASSLQDIRQAIEIYERIFTKFPYFRQMDLVLFNSGFASQQVGDYPKAVKHYRALIERFPNSDMVPDGYLAVGEMKFDEKKFDEALENFLKVKSYPHSRVFPYGLYKAAWSYYNLRQSPQAMRMLEEVVEFGKRVQEEKLDSKLDLRKEALADMTVFFEGVYASKDALSYFKKQAGEIDIGPTIIRLAGIYERYSRYEDQKIVLSDFVEESPRNIYRASAQNSLVNSYDALKRRDLATDALKTLEKVCQPDSSWSKNYRRELEQKKLKEPPEPCAETGVETSVRMADRWLKLWKKDVNNKEMGDQTEIAFEVYLRLIPLLAEQKRKEKQEEISKSRYAYAEMLFQRGKYRPASAQYHLVVSEATEKELAHDAGYAAIVSLQKASGEKMKDEDEKRFFFLSGDYLKRNPTGKYALDVEFQQALVHYEKARWPQAEEAFFSIGDRYPKEAKGQKAQDLYLDILNIKKDYARLRDYARELLAKSQTPERAQMLQGVFEEASFAEIQRLEDKQDPTRAIAEYKKFAILNPRSKLASKSWWNALQLEFKTGRYRDVAQTAARFQEMFPNDPKAKDALLKSAQTYETLGQLDRAGDVLMKLAAVDEKQSSEWTFLAADFLALSGDVVKSRELFLKLASQPNGKNAAASLQKLYLYEKDASEKNRVLRQLARLNVQPQSAWAQVQLLEASFKEGNLEEVFVEAKRLVGSSAPNSYRARARILQARILEDEFRRQSLKAQLSRVEMVLALKTEKLEKAQQAYQDVIRLGDPHASIEALERLAGCYLHYSEAVSQMPIPPGTPDEEAKAFRSELSKLSTPLQEKGVESLSEAIELSKRTGLRDGTTARLQIELNRHNLQENTAWRPEISPPAWVVPRSEVGS